MNLSEVVAITQVHALAVTGQTFTAILQLHMDGTTSWKEKYVAREPAPSGDEGHRPETGGGA